MEEQPKPYLNNNLVYIPTKIESSRMKKIQVIIEH